MRTSRTSGMLLRGCRRAVAVLLVWAATVLAASAATVRGRLDRVDGYGRHYPATNVAVTLSNATGWRSSPVYTDQTGMYYLNNVPMGVHNLEIWWSRDPNQKPMVFQVTVNRDPTDVAPIVVP